MGWKLDPKLGFKVIDDGCSAPRQSCEYSTNFKGVDRYLVPEVG